MPQPDHCAGDTRRKEALGIAASARQSVTGLAKPRQSSWVPPTLCWPSSVQSEKRAPANLIGIIHAGEERAGKHARTCILHPGGHLLTGMDGWSICLDHR